MSVSPFRRTAEVSQPPTWQDVVDASVAGQTTGYDLGFADGLRAAADELDAEVLRERAAAVARGVVSSMGVKAAREKADTYPDARGPVRRWVA